MGKIIFDSERYDEVRRIAHAFADFDGTITPMHSHSKLHKYAAGHDLGKWAPLVWNAMLCVAKDALRYDNSGELERLARTLTGTDFEEAAGILIPKMKLNPGLARVREVIGDEGPIYIVPLTKNDRDLVDRACEKMAPAALELYGIQFLPTIGNHYVKNENGIYTGEMTVHVAGNKRDYFEGLPFFGDLQDRFRYKGYDQFYAIDGKGL